jgi:hypothetical protein
MLVYYQDLNPNLCVSSISTVLVLGYRVIGISIATLSNLQLGGPCYGNILRAPKNCFDNNFDTAVHRERFVTYAILIRRFHTKNPQVTPMLFAHI